MMAEYKCAFDEEGRRLAILSTDGRIRVWDCSSGSLRQEYVAAAALDVTCTCLCWSKSRRTKETYQGIKTSKAKKKRIVENENITIGASDGSVFVLSATAGELIEKRDFGHTKTVNDLCYCKEQQTVYSASDDKHITEWDSSHFKLKKRWEADQVGVKKLSAGPTGKTLLSAGRQIKLWDLDSKELLQKFNGHANPVNCLLWTPVRSAHSNSENNINGFYFLSCAENDELVNAWQVNLKKQSQNSIAAFLLPSSPVSIDIGVTEDEDKPVNVVAACKNGEVCLMSHALNGRCAKPIVPEYSTKIVKALTSENEESDDNSAVQLLTSRLSFRKNDFIVTIVYGSHLKPIFEKLKQSDLKEPFLKRDVPDNLLLSSKKSQGVKSVGDASSSGKYAVVGDLSSLRPVGTKTAATATPTSGEGENREEQPVTGDAVPFSQRIRDFMPSSQLTERIERPTAASTSTLIIQALQRDDDKMLFNTVRKNQNPTIVRTTMERFPITLIVPFLRKLGKKIEDNHQWIHYCTLWLRLTMEVHMSFLLSIPHLRNSFNGIYQILEERTTNFRKLNQLHGRLDLVLAFATSKQREAKGNITGLSKPVAHFHEDDTDVEIEYDPLRHMGMTTESEEDWSPSSGEDSGNDENELSSNNRRKGKGKKLERKRHHEDSDIENSEEENNKEIIEDDSDVEND